MTKLYGTALQRGLVGGGMELTCRACGSQNVLQSAQIIINPVLGSYPVTVKVPGTLALKGGAHSRVSAHICVDCGRIALEAQDLAALRNAYTALGQPLGLNE